MKQPSQNRIRCWWGKGTRIIWQIKAEEEETVRGTGHIGSSMHVKQRRTTKNGEKDRQQPEKSSKKNNCIVKWNRNR